MQLAERQIHHLTELKAKAKRQNIIGNGAGEGRGRGHGPHFLANVL